MKKIRLLAIALLLIAPPISRQLSENGWPIPECPTVCSIN